jgi:hypothetical protein
VSLQGRDDPGRVLKGKGDIASFKAGYRPKKTEDVPGCRDRKAGNRSRQKETGAFVCDKKFFKKEEIVKKKSVIGLVLGIFLASFAIAGSAGAATLASLLPPTGSTISSGGMTFSDFSYSTSTVPPATIPPATHITVLPVFQATTEPGLGFAGTGWFAGKGTSLLSPISFSVEPTLTTMGIDDVSLQGAAIVAGGGSVSVTEYVYTNSSTPDLLTTLNFSSTTSTTFDISSIFTTPGVYQSLYVVDTVTVTGGTSRILDSSVGFDNRFALAPAPVPAPSALLLFAPGLLGLIGIRKRVRS